jgi:hypothetical protein
LIQDIAAKVISLEVDLAREYNVSWEDLAAIEEERSSDG